MTCDTCELMGTFNKVARDVSSRYPGVVEADDISQELWAWWLGHDQPALSGDWASQRTLYTVAERYCQKERTAQVGPIDPTRYTEAEVFALVEFIVNPETDTQSLTDQMSEVGTAVFDLDKDLRGPLVRRAAGYSYREVSEEFGVSVATAHRRVQQALYAITTKLNGEA